MQEISQEFINSLIDNDKVDILTQSIIENVDWICKQTLTNRYDVVFSDRTLRYDFLQKKWFLL